MRLEEKIRHGESEWSLKAVPVLGWVREMWVSDGGGKFSSCE
jgi:hypothetical protein